MNAPKLPNENVAKIVAAIKANPFLLRLNDGGFRDELARRGIEACDAEIQEALEPASIKPEAADDPAVIPDTEQDANADSSAPVEATAVTKPETKILDAKGNESRTLSKEEADAARANKQKARLYDQTDAGNAELFAELYVGKVLWDYRQKRWLVWDEKKQRWYEDKKNRVQRFMKKAAQERLQRCLKWPTEEDTQRKKQGYEIGHALDSQNHHKIVAALKSAQTEPKLEDSDEPWDGDPTLFGVANGVVDLKTGRFRQGTPKDKITKFSPVVYDAAAKCPLWEKCLNDWFGGDRDLIAYIQRLCGYTLSGSTTEDCIIMSYGEGGNGKTTFYETILYIMGDYGVTIPFSMLEVKRERPLGEGVNLPGARFAKSVETREGTRFDEARIKALTSSDTQVVRPLYGGFFEFKPSHKIWLAFNHKPVITDTTESIWRRVRLLPFAQKFLGNRRDLDLLDKLKAEAPGILNWMLAGCSAWQHDGLKMPEAVEKATAEYRAESDPLASFISERFEIGAGFRAPKSEVSVAYSVYCQRNRETPLSSKAFAAQMKRLGFKEGNSEGRYWAGLRLARSGKTVGEQIANLANVSDLESAAD